MSNELVVRVLSHIKHSATRRVLYCDKTLLLVYYTLHNKLHELLPDPVYHKNHLRTLESIHFLNVEQNVSKTVLSHIVSVHLYIYTNR